jgi:hypothetical protein
MEKHEREAKEWGENKNQDWTWDLLSRACEGVGYWRYWPWGLAWECWWRKLDSAWGWWRGRWRFRLLARCWRRFVWLWIGCNNGFLGFVFLYLVFFFFLTFDYSFYGIASVSLGSQ